MQAYAAFGLSLRVLDLPITFNKMTKLSATLAVVALLCAAGAATTARAAPLPRANAGGSTTTSTSTSTSTTTTTTTTARNAAAPAAAPAAGSGGQLNCLETAPPPAPVELKLASVKRTTAKVTWYAAAGNACVSTFKVFLEPVAAKAARRAAAAAAAAEGDGNGVRGAAPAYVELQQAALFGKAALAAGGAAPAGQLFSATLAGMAPGADYRFAVQAVNRKGAGRNATLTFRTRA